MGGAQQREGVGARHDQAHRRHEDEEAGGHRDQAGTAEDAGGHHQQPGGGERDHGQSGAEHLVEADPADQDLAVELADTHQADRVEAEEQAEGLRGGAVDLLDDERRGGDIGEESGEGEGADEEVAGEGAVGEQIAHGAQGLAEAAGVTAGGRQGLVEPAPHQEGERHPDDGEDDEHTAPVGDPQDLAADERGDDRRRSGDQHQGGEEPGHRHAVVQIADHRPGDDDPGGTRQALQQAAADEEFGSGGERAQRGRQDVDHHAGQQRAAAAPLVAHRADDHLAQRHARQAGGQGELDGGGRAVQGRGDLRQGRQIHVHGERRDRREAAEDEGDEEAGAAGRGQRGRCARCCCRAPLGYGGKVRGIGRAGLRHLRLHGSSRAAPWCHARDGFRGVPDRSLGRKPDVPRS